MTRKTQIVLAGLFTLGVLVLPAAAQEDPLASAEPTDLPVARELIDIGGRVELSDAQQEALVQAINTHADGVTQAREAMAAARERLREAQIAMLKAVVADLEGELETRQQRALERLEKRLIETDRLLAPLPTKAEREKQAQRRAEREAEKEANSEEEVSPE